MSDEEYFIKRGDTGKKIEAILVGPIPLLGADPEPADLQGATVRFHLKRAPAGPVKIAANASNDQNGTGADGTKGKVSYTWAGTDTETVGDYYSEWQVTFAGGAIQTFPNDGHSLVHITEELG